MSINTTTKLIQEVCDYIYKNGQYPPRGVLSSDGKDLGKALTRYRSGELSLSKEQVELLAQVDDFLSRTEKNIVELEKYYAEHNCLPLGDTNARLREVMKSYKSGEVPLTASQKERLERIGVLLDSTERMVQAIEAYCDKYHKAPGRGKKSPEGYDMGSAIIGYRNGKRKLTLAQKNRLEAKGIALSNATLKAEANITPRIIGEKTTLSVQIKQLKEERDKLIKTEIQKRTTHL